MPWQELPCFVPPRSSMLKLREKWKTGWSCYDFRDDGLGICETCNREWYMHHYEARSREFEKLLTLKREMTAKFLREMTSGESVDLFAEPVDVPAAIEWFLRWMEFRTSF